MGVKTANFSVGISGQRRLGGVYVVRTAMSYSTTTVCKEIGNLGCSVLSKNPKDLKYLGTKGPRYSTISSVMALQYSAVSFPE